jgi:hypothetical protein
LVVHLDGFFFAVGGYSDDSTAAEWRATRGIAATDRSRLYLTALLASLNLLVLLAGRRTESLKRLLLLLTSCLKPALLSFAAAPVAVPAAGLAAPCGPTLLLSGGCCPNICVFPNSG